MTHIRLYHSEKQRLEENSQSLAERAESTSTVVNGLKGTVKEKEQELKVTQVYVACLISSDVNV